MTMIRTALRPDTDAAGSEPQASHDARQGHEARSAAAAAWGGAATSLVGLAGVVCGIVALAGRSWSLSLDGLFPMVGVQLELTPLGGLFMLLTGAVAVIVGIYSAGYTRAGHLGGFPLAVMPIFVATMLLVPAAGSVPTFLLMWELMAVSSMMLVLAGHRRAEVRSAGVYYAVLTHLGFMAILLGLLLLSAATGTTRFAEISFAIGDVGHGARTVIFVLTLLGFGSKAGLLPLHAWLPRAHAESPSPASALMSAAMVTLGVYGIVRIDLDILGPGPRWWGLVMLAVGAVSALFGVLQASVATDLKRLLAFSTTENMGLVLVALGAAALLTSSGMRDVAALALAAGLLHLLVHGSFKMLAFLAAGSVQNATGLRDLDRLGGLAHRMPVTTALFGVAALGAAGLPVGAGFVSEWLLLQSLIHRPAAGDTLMALTMPLAIGVVALSVGVGVVTMVKAFGVGFLARPRTDEAAHAREAGAPMLLAMALAALVCTVLALVPAALDPALRALGRTLPVPVATLGGVVIGPAGGLGSIAPAVLAAGMASAVILAVALSRIGSRRRPPAQSAAPLWACGADGLTSRMEYTASSFAQPMQRVFRGVLRPEADLSVVRAAGSAYDVEQMAYRERPTDAVEAHLYRPVLRLVRAVAGWVRRAHTGSVQLYLVYGGVGLLIVLVLAR